MTSADLAALVERMRDRLAEAHQCIAELKQEAEQQGRKAEDDEMFRALRAVANVSADLVDLCIDLNDRVPMSTEAFGEVLGGK